MSYLGNAPLVCQKPVGMTAAVPRDPPRQMSGGDRLGGEKVLMLPEMKVFDHDFGLMDVFLRESGLGAPAS
jgi:hypothetical protein